MTLMNTRRLTRSVAATALVLAAPWAASAQPAPQPQGVVGLAASATAEVTRDLLNVTLSTTREGTDAAVVQSGLKQALDAALAEARKVAKPGQIEVQTGNFSLFPRYSNKGVITGWQGTAELQVQGRDIPGIARLTGRISTMTIARVGTDLSREQREKVESDLTAQAITAYRAKAAEYAKAFGYGGYVIREVSVGANEPVQYAMAARMERKSAMGADEALPVEMGKGNVTVNVTGTVQMTP